MLRRILAAGLVLASAAAGLALASPASAVTAPRTPTGLPSAIEPLAPYVAQTSCDPTTKPGTAKLAALLAATYRGTSYNTSYACGTDGNISEHYDGRAIDWMVSVRNRVQYADAKAVLSWLLATDRQGNHFAMARRLGVQYVIYNNRIWGSWNGKWDAYNGCAKLTARSHDSWCHRDHMHISLSWNGAKGRTSFWTRHVYPNDYGPCRVIGLNWSPNYTRPNPNGCRTYSTVKPPRGSSSTKVALVKYSGAALRPRLTGPAVTAVQRALRVPTTGRFDTATLAAMRRLQSAHRLTPTSAVTVATWRVLLKTTR